MSDWKPHKGKIVFALVGMFLLGLIVLKEAVLNKFAHLLIVDQAVETVDAVVTVDISERVISCYKEGRCPRVYLFIGDLSHSWKALRSINLESLARKKAREAGIRMEDLITLSPVFASDVEYVNYFETLFSRKGVRSALFVQPFYKTRRYDFYFSRFLKSGNLKIYVQPLEDNYENLLHEWWKNTMLDNLFAAEFFRILYYYFNKALWSPIH